ncbi:hypothetical protein [Merismopedia glauca]|uniref:Uncharacterized protein n=1 Tax=Merismopedia glauca CCAP 1448/3 TaxID=1296344 RepID=A0A2T1C4E5_9CYAN|nr:hypothetical protein [Merismopedia glauca]PSB03121.1 hypothetical protein C7B64_09925 [Merismopedia glauca CCAP 1448/3]
MSQNKLHIYIASTLLVNVLIGAELLPPAHAKSDETRNSVDKLALNTSSQTDADAFLLESNAAKINITQLHQGEVTSSPFGSEYHFTSKNQGLSTTTTTDIFQEPLIQHFDSTLIEKDIEVLSTDGLDLDSILDREFNRREFLISRCCF